MGWGTLKCFMINEGVSVIVPHFGGIGSVLLTASDVLYEQVPRVVQDGWVLSECGRRALLPSLFDTMLSAFTLDLALSTLRCTRPLILSVESTTSGFDDSGNISTLPPSRRFPSLELAVMNETQPTILYGIFTLWMANLKMSIVVSCL